ncbi:hypothetical protein J3F83DRAFT_721532 [Trichoderma novae-zelandiae]
MARGTVTLKPSAEAPYTGRITRSRAASQKKQQQEQQQQQQPPPPKLRRSKRKRPVGDDDDDDGDKGGGDDNDDDNNSKDKAPPPKKKRGPNRCKFCGADPVGKQMYQQRPCDFTKIWKENFIECQNCADHRSQNPGIQHKCQPPNIKQVWRQYGVADPTTYTPATCDQCAGGKLAHQCNVDPILGYGCTTTKACRDGTCTVNGLPMEKPPRPQANVVRWTRTECHVCENKTKKGTATAGCSWLRDRTSWDQACTYCQAHNLVCMSGGNVVASPASLTLPNTWALNQKVFDWGFIECRAINPHRRNCKRCLEDGHEHCRVDAGAYGFACNRCSQLGVDCIDSKDDTHYPIFDLARVGIGGIMPFPECSCCTRHGRNCDLQRPCDSCVKHGDECDEFKGVTARYCFNGRLDPPPGPLYYLALGYGPQGVDDPKDGSAIEHWVGPMTNIYSMLPDKQKKEYLAALGVHLRAKLHPPGRPPHGDAAQGGLVLGRASAITQQQIAAWIQAQWPEARPMDQFDVFQGYVNEAQQQVQIVRAGGVGARIPTQVGNGEDDDDDGDGNGDGNEDGDDGGNHGGNHGDDGDGNDGDDGDGNDGAGDALMGGAAASDDEERARINAAGIAAARALARSAIASPPAPAPAPASAPSPLEVDGDSTHWLLGYISQDNIATGDADVAPAQFGNSLLPTQEQFNFDAALGSSRMMSDVDFDPFGVSLAHPNRDINIDPDLSMEDVIFNPFGVPFFDPRMDVNIDLGSDTVNANFNTSQVPVSALDMDINDINFDDINIDDIDLNDLNIDAINAIDAFDIADIDFNLDGDLYTDFNPIQVPDTDASVDMDYDPDLYRAEPNFDPFQVPDDADIDSAVVDPDVQVGTDHSAHTGTDPATGLLNTPSLDYAMTLLLMPYMRGGAPAEDQDRVD